MASGGMVPSSIAKPRADAMLVDKLPEQINEMEIKDEKVEKEMEVAMVDRNGTETGHIIVTTIGGGKMLLGGYCVSCKDIPHIRCCGCGHQGAGTCGCWKPHGQFRCIEFYDAMSVPMAIALSGHLFLG